MFLSQEVPFRRITRGKTRLGSSAGLILAEAHLGKKPNRFVKESPPSLRAKRFKQLVGFKRNARVSKDQTLLPSPPKTLGRSLGSSQEGSALLEVDVVLLPSFMLPTPQPPSGHETSWDTWDIVFP